MNLPESPCAKMRNIIDRLDKSGLEELATDECRAKISEMSKAMFIRGLDFIGDDEADQINTLEIIMLICAMSQSMEQSIKALEQLLEEKE